MHAGLLKATSLSLRNPAFGARVDVPQRSGGIIPMRFHLLLGAVAVAALTAGPASSQGIVRGAEQGAAVGNKAAGPVGGAVGGAVGGVAGGVAGGVKGVLGIPQNTGTIKKARRSTSRKHAVRH
jgi:hypothetical protein